MLQPAGLEILVAALLPERLAFDKQRSGYKTASCHRQVSFRSSLEQLLNRVGACSWLLVTKKWGSPKRKTGVLFGEQTIFTFNAVLPSDISKLGSW